MPPQTTTMDPFQQQQSHGNESPTRREQQADDSSWDDYYAIGGSRRRRQSLGQSSNTARSRSEESHSFVPPQYSLTSQDVRQSRQKWLQEQHEKRRAASARQSSSSMSAPIIAGAAHQHDRYSIPASEPTHHDIDESSFSTATSRDSSISLEVSTTSRERLNLFPSPMGSPVLHRGESIQLQAKRAARSNPGNTLVEETSAASSDQKSRRNKDALLMFGDPEDNASVMTGMSQQELIVRNAVKSAKQKRDLKKYRKPREKKRNVRILNLPASLSNHSAASSPPKRKYQRGVSDMDPAEDNALGEQAPVSRQKNILSRYSGARRRSSDPGSTSATEDVADRRRAWNLMASLTSSRSGDSSQNSVGTSTSVGASTHASKEDLLAQAAEDWIKSTEETGAAQFSAEEEDFVRAETDARQVSARLVADQDSISTNGSDDERPTLEDGAFPSLKDARIPFGPTRLSFDKEAALPDEAQWQDVSPRSTDLFIETRSNNTGPWDKMSEESPVSVMAVPNRRVRRATASSQTRTLLPPKESARRRRPSSRPASILRSGRHNGAKEVSAKIQSVKSARVKFHEEVLVRGELNAKQQAPDSNEYAKSSKPDSFASMENVKKDKAIDTMTPQDWTAFIERDTTVLSPVSEVDSQQTEQSLQSGTSDRKSEPVETLLSMSSANDAEWPLRMGELKPSTVRGEINMFPEVPDSDQEWALNEDDRASFGTFGQFKAEVAMDGGSTSEEENHDFMETVAAIVIQTAVRRMIAIDATERMLIEASLEDVRDLDAFSIEYGQPFGIDDASPKKQSYPPENNQRFEAFHSQDDAPSESFVTRNESRVDDAATKKQSYPSENDRRFEASLSQDEVPSGSFLTKNVPSFDTVPQDFAAAFPSSGDNVLETRSPETSETPYVQKLSPSLPTTEPSQRSGEGIVEQDSSREHGPVVANPEREVKARPLTEDDKSAKAAPTKTKRKFDFLLSKYENNVRAFSSMDEPRATTNSSIQTNIPKDEPVVARQPEKQDGDSNVLPSVTVQQSRSFPDKEERDLDILPAIDSPQRQTTPLLVDDAALEAVPYHMYDIAAIQIQSTFRGWWVRDSLNVDHYCACRIQRAYRSFRERMSFVFDIYRIAIIQSLWRRKLAKKEVDRLRRLKVQKTAEKSRRLAARREAEKVRRLAAQRDAERLRKKEAEELEAKRLRELAAQKEKEELEAKRIQEAAAEKEAEEREAKRLRELAAQKEAEELDAKRQAEREAEERELERRRKLTADIEAEKHRMLEAKRMEQEREAERLREQAAFQAAREEAERLEADRIWTERREAATIIQSHWRSSEARVECLNRLVSILLLQSIARRWLARTQVLRNVRELASQEASDQVKRATEVHLWSPVESDESTASDDSVQAITGETVSDITKEIDNVAVADGDVVLSKSEERSEKKEKGSESIYRTKSEVEADEGDDGQKWVTVSHSYDEETFVQSYATEKSAAVNSLESKEKAEVSKLSADELIELFIHTSVTTNKDSSRSITPLRMESPVNGPSVTSSAATSLVDETIHEERPKFQGRPPRQEKLEKPNETLDREVLLAKEKVDRMNARLAMNNAAVKKA